MGLLGNLRGGRFGGFIDISRRSIRSLARGSGADPHQKAVREATREAVKSAVKLAGSGYAIREMAQKTGVPTAVLKKMTRVKVSNKRDFMRVWFGLNPLNLRDLNPKQDSSGVTAGPARVASGFIVKKLKGNVFKRKGFSRLPIRKQVYDVRTQGEDAAKAVYNKMLAHFERNLPYVVEARLKNSGLI
jgi:hypothetical protein